MLKDVHPQIQTILDRAAELGLKSAQDLGVTAARAQAESLAVAGRKSFPSPTVQDVENTTTGAGYGHVAVRIYRPSQVAKAPVIVFYHGGGHVICSLETHDTIARYLALETGCTLVSVDYRMAPEHPFPAAVNDSFDALRWVSDKAETLRVDPSRITVCGDSAGANLAAVVAIMARDHGAMPVAAQVLIYPVIDYRGGTASYDRYGKGYGSLGAATMKWFLEKYLPNPDQRDDWRACPANAELDARLPPALVITAQCDVLHDDGFTYADQLKQAGVPVEYMDFKGMPHGFFGFLGGVDDAERAHKAVGRFLRALPGLVRRNEIEAGRAFG